MRRSGGEDGKKAPSDALVRADGVVAAPSDALLPADAVVKRDSTNRRLHSERVDAAKSSPLPLMLPLIGDLDFGGFFFRILPRHTF